VHANGPWAKKIRGKVHHVGLWSDRHGALCRLLREMDDNVVFRLKKGRWIND
jgi:hypothetical protein